VRSGSGYVGRHGKDFLTFNDTWSQTLNQLYDQDGSVFIIDWYDKNQCHHGREDGHDRANGRIYKIVYENQKTTRVDLAKLSDEELVKLVPSKNEFRSRHARRLLQERAAERGLQSACTTALKQMFATSHETAAKLRALWALHVTGGFDVRTGVEGIKSTDEWVRAWIIQLVFESQENLERLIREADEQGLKPDPDLNTLAESDPSLLVRLFLASAIQRATDPDFRKGLLKRLVTHAEDAEDHNLPLMYWFAAEPLVAEDPALAETLLTTTKIPKLRPLIARRMTAASQASR
jgi:hypothetical protein